MQKSKHRKGLCEDKRGRPRRPILGHDQPQNSSAIDGAREFTKSSNLIWRSFPRPMGIIGLQFDEFSLCGTQF
jgi:hypothetical protein